MKQLHKPAKMAVVAAGASIIALTGGAGVLAATNSSATSGTSPESSLVDKLVNKFGLNKSDVQAVFDEAQSERQAERQQQLGERLTQAVTDGKLTEDQKSQIVAKQQEMQTFMESLKDKTMEERRTAMDGKRTELEQWAATNNIPEQFARFATGMGGRHGGPEGMMRNGHDTAKGPAGSSGDPIGPLGATTED